MDRSALRAPHPSVPTLTHGRDSKDKRVFSILRDLDKIKTSKKKKQIKRCELLINNIAQLLRKNSGDDHLFQTTSIWVLITIFRLFPSDTKGMMTAAGIPGCLFDVIKNGNLSGSSRQYASELCFYLSTNHPHPGDAWGSGAPMDMLPEVQMVNRYRPDLDDVTMLSDVSSNAEEIKTRQAFVPYRIDPHNMQKLDALFEEGYHNQLAASLPNHLLLSKYGFSSYIREKGEIESSDDEDDEDLDDEDEKGNRHAKDDDSAFSSISSASRSTSMTLGGSLPNSSRRFDFNLSHSLADVLPGGDLDSARSRTSQASFSRMKNKNYANDLIADLTGKRSKPTQFSPFGLGKLRRQDSETSQGSIGSAQPPHPSRLPVQVVNKPYSSLQPIVPQSLQTLETARSFGSLEAAAHTRNEISPQLNRHRSYSHHAIEKQSHVAASTPARIDHHVSGTPHRMIQHLRNDRSSTSHMPHRMASNTATLQRSRDVHSAHPLSQSLDTGLTAPKEIGVFGDWVMPYRPSKHAGLGENSQVLQSKSFFSSEFEDTMEKPSNDIDAYFSNLDPLALSLKSTVKSHHKVEQSGIVPVEEEEGGWILSSDEDDELYEGIKAGGDWDNEDDEDDLAQITNEFVLKKRLRMRAEKLIDHSFVRKLFVKKSKVQDSQDLIHRMEQLLELLDPDKSGYITFEAFTRLILAVAPRHVVRADVMNFMNAQSKRNDDLVDYNEFIISGKVLILTKAQRQQALEDRSRLRNLPKGAKEAFEYRNESSSTMVWLKRQKEYVGQNSTYTWKNHLKWYQRRKAQALIWLVRRATRSLKHEVVLDEARRFLALKAKHAIAWSELIEIGRASLRTQSKGAMAKRRLMKRAMHARRFMIKLTEAQEYLRGTALTAIKDLDYMDRVLSVREKRELVSRGEVTEAKIALAKKTQANYAALFKMKALRNLAIQFLVDHSRKAMVHCARQDEALDFMRAMVYKAQKQLTLKDKARRELLLRAEAAYAFCLAQDQALLNLLRVGGDALMHMDRQVKALSWLIQRGEEAHKFTEGKLKTRLELVKIGQRTLRYMNRREEAHIYLNKRRLKSQAFVIRRKEAIHFLKECPRDVWRIIDNCNAAQAWLVARAARAKIYVVNRIRAAHHLQVSYLCLDVFLFLKVLIFSVFFLNLVYVSTLLPRRLSHIVAVISRSKSSARSV